MTATEHLKSAVPEIPTNLIPTIVKAMEEYKNDDSLLTEGERIVKEVAAQFNLPASRVKTKNAQGKASDARKIACDLMYDVGGLTYKEIGEILNIRYISARAMRISHRELYWSDKEYQKTYLEIKSKL